MSEIYRTAVTKAGQGAEDFLSEHMFVTFGPEAPASLREFCFIVDVNPVTGDIKPGQTLVIDGQPFPITAVGDVAQRNLNSLGHVTIAFDGASAPKMSGNIHIQVPGNPPAPKVGSQFSIEEP